jgi:Raf kinase inhibitor-like YbhB/YbcL family protein
MPRTLLAILMIMIPLAISAGEVEAQQQSTTATQAFQMESVFYDEDWIPLQYSCGAADGASPDLRWKNAPPGTITFALIFHDTDAAPGNNAMDVTHWILWNIPAGATQLPAGVAPNATPDGIQQGKNIRSMNGYQPPCPPPGVRPHHYIFELYALDTKLELPMGSSRADLSKAMDGHIIGKASLVGIFGQGIDEKTWRWGTAKLPEH